MVPTRSKATEMTPLKIGDKVIVTYPSFLIGQEAVVTRIRDAAYADIVMLHNGDKWKRMAQEDLVVPEEVVEDWVVLITRIYPPNVVALGPWDKDTAIEKRRQLREADPLEKDYRLKVSQLTKEI